MAIGIRRRWRHLIRWASSNDGIWGAVGIIVALIALVIATMLDWYSSLESNNNSKTLNGTMRKNDESLKTVNETLKRQITKLDASLIKETEYVENIKKLSRDIGGYQAAIMHSNDSLAGRIDRLRYEIARLKKSIADDKDADNASLASILDQSRINAERHMTRLADLIGELNGAVEKLNIETKRSNVVVEQGMRRIELKALDSTQYGHENSCELGTCRSLFTVRKDTVQLGGEYYITFTVAANQMSSPEVYLLVHRPTEGVRSIPCDEFIPDELVSVEVGGNVIEAMHLEPMYDTYPIKLKAGKLMLRFKKMARGVDPKAAGNANLYRFSACISSHSTSIVPGATVCDISIAAGTSKEDVEEIMQSGCFFANGLSMRGTN